MEEAERDLDELVGVLRAAKDVLEFAREQSVAWHSTPEFLATVDSVLSRYPDNTAVDDAPKTP